TVAMGMLGTVRTLRGEGARARQLLLEAHQSATRIELTPVELLSMFGLAMLEDIEGDPTAAAQRIRAVLARWAQSEDRHYTIPALRWGASLFARLGEETDARACANALAQIVADTGAA